MVRSSQTGCGDAREMAQRMRPSGAAGFSPSSRLEPGVPNDASAAFRVLPGGTAGSLPGATEAARRDWLGAVLLVCLGNRFALANLTTEEPGPTAGRRRTGAWHRGCLDHLGRGKLREPW